MMSLMESHLYLVGTLPPKTFTFSELKDMHSLIGLKFNSEDRESWGFEEGSDISGEVFMFTFEGEEAHDIAKMIKPHKAYPVIYINVE